MIDSILQMKIHYLFFLLLMYLFSSCKDSLSNSQSESNSEENTEPEFLSLISDEVTPGVRTVDLTIVVDIDDIIPNSVFDYTYSSMLNISNDSIPTQDNNVGFDQIEEIGLVFLDREKKEGISWRSIVSLEPDTEYFYEHIFYYDNELDQYGAQSISTGVNSFRTNQESLEFGGVVFYDKGDTTGGWRYLVAAPGDWYKGDRTFTNYKWGCEGVDVKNTKGGLGYGFENTKRIIESDCVHDSGDPSAGIYISELELNGYSDWYLPNIDEISKFIGLSDELGLCCLPILSSNEVDSNSVLIRWHEFEQVEAIPKSDRNFIHPIRRH